MRPITGADITAFHTSRTDLLILTANGTFDHIDTSDIHDDENTQATAYSFITLHDGTEAQILLEATTITNGDWFEDALDDDGNLIPSIADDMAEIINQDGILPSRTLKAAAASKAWEDAERTTNALAAARASAVAEVAAYAGNQSAAGRLLGLDPSTVNKLVRKARRAV